MSDLVLRTTAGKWSFDQTDPTNVEHCAGRGMWHPNRECTIDLCGAFPEDAFAMLAKYHTPPPLVEPAMPRVFSLVRYDDVSEVSGTGIVAQGVQYRDGQVSMQWCCPGLPSSVAVWGSIEDVLTIHGHRGRTVVKWGDGRD